mgnify:CR=1 FL=1
MIKKTIINKTKKNKTQKQTKKNTNTHIINVLTLVKEYYKEKNDKIRVNSYEKAIYQISKFIKPIMKGSELAHLDGIGKGMVEKIDTIISSGTLPILNDIQKIKNNSNNTNSNTNPNTNTNTKLNTLLGFSNTFVTKLINKYNTRTISNVKQLVNNNKLKLTKIQTLGLNYYKDLQTLIPRDEITKLTNIFKTIVNNTNYTMLVSGSYPSNTKHYSKDIDILIVKHKHLKDNIGSGDLKNIINKIKIYFEELNKDKENNKENYLESISLGSKKFMGLIKSPISNKMRHIDIRLVTMNELPYSYLYYSSGKMFNKLIREKFKKKGYKLNEYGLYKIRYNKDFEKIKIDEESNLVLDNINIKNREINLLNYIKKIEQELFKLASMDYKTVQERY